MLVLVLESSGRWVGPRAVPVSPRVTLGEILPHIARKGWRHGPVA